MGPTPGNLPTHRSSVVKLSPGKGMVHSDVSKDNDPSNSDNAGDDPSVTGNEDLDKWIWIIEYLAKFKTELSLVHDVFESVPELPDNLGDHTDEAVALRCLASLFDTSTPESSNGVVSGAETKVEFDSSESCEYVLQCILDEIPLSELKPGAPGLSKWNLVPFIKSKILCLPKCTLKLIIESETAKTNGKETDQITPRLAEQDEHGDDGYADESEDVISDHVSSPSEPIYECRQCKKSGKLLFCSSENCTFMVHERCIGSPPTYDDAGNYYCHLCVNTFSSSEYLQCQAELGKARKKLGLFLQLMSKVNKKISIGGSINGDPTTNH